MSDPEDVDLPVESEFPLSACLFVLWIAVMVIIVTVAAVALLIKEVKPG